MIAKLVAVLRGEVDAAHENASGWTSAFLILLATLPAFGVIAYGVEAARAELSGLEPTTIPWAAFGTVALLYSLAFPAVALVMGTVFGRPESAVGWVGVRHWAVFLLAWTLAALWALTLVGLPFSIANFALFAGILGILALDIRLAQVAGGFSLGAAVLVASVIGTLGMTLMLAGLQFYVSG